MADALALEAAKTAGEAHASARISAILDCDEARGRDKLARHFAFRTAMSVDDAKAALALAAPESTPAGARMAQVPNPKVGADSTQRPIDGQAEIDAMYAGFAAKLNAALPDRWRPRA